MSFSFNAIGTAPEVAAQLSVYETDNVLGARLAETLAEQLGDQATMPDGSGYECRYVVKASGNSGKGAAFYLTASVEALWVPVVAVEIAAAIETVTPIDAIEGDTDPDDED